MSQYYPTSYDTAALRPASGIERAVAALCHVSMLCSLPILVPAAVLLLNAFVLNGSPYVRRQSLQALLFHLLVVSASAISGLLAGAFFFHGWLFLVNLLTWPIALLFGVISIGVLIWGVVVEIIATVKAIQGQPYQLPIVGRF